MTEHPLKRPRLRRFVGRATGLLVAVTTLVTLPAGVANAHHGWDDFDTDRLYYLAGTVSDVRWGEPHSSFSITVASDMAAQAPDHELPEQLQDPQQAAPIRVAPSYPGPHDSLAVVIAPPSFTGRWGLDRPLRDGERIELVSYVGRSHDDELRPAAFWYEDGRPVNQVLGDELPAISLAVPYPGQDADAGEASDSTDAIAATDAERVSAIATWVGLEVVAGAAIAGGALYLRSRSRDV